MDDEAYLLECIRAARRKLYGPPRSGPKAQSNLIDALKLPLEVLRKARSNPSLKRILRDHCEMAGIRIAAGNFFVAPLKLFFPTEAKDFYSTHAGFLCFAYIEEWKVGALRKSLKTEQSSRKRQKRPHTYDAIAKEGRARAQAHPELKQG